MEACLARVRLVVLLATFLGNILSLDPSLIGHTDHRLPAGPSANNRL